MVISCNTTTKKLDSSIQANDTATYVEATDVYDVLATPDVSENILIENTNIVDSLEVENITMRHDTMSILGWADYIIFPFGKFKTPEDIHKAYPYFEFKKIQYAPYDNDKSYLIDRFIYMYQNSTVNYTESEPDYYLDIRDSDIYDERIVLKNNIHVGVGKEDFFKTLMIECDNTSDVNTVELICTLSGYSQYYTFVSDTIKSISLRTW